MRSLPQKGHALIPAPWRGTARTVPPTVAGMGTHGTLPATSGGMIPLLASGAASLANVLINRVGGSASNSSGNVTLDAKAFERALNKVSGSRANMSPAEQQSAALNQRLMQSPEVEAALTAQPVGAVNAIQVRQDGSMYLETSQGPVAVQLTQEARELARQAYAASSVGLSSGANASSNGLQSSLRLPVQGAALR